MREPAYEPLKPLTEVCPRRTATRFDARRYLWPPCPRSAQQGHAMPHATHPVTVRTRWLTIR